jgi:hypothetical protein
MNHFLQFKEREKGGGTRNQKVFAQPVHISDATKAKGNAPGRRCTRHDYPREDQLTVASRFKCCGGVGCSPAAPAAPVAVAPVESVFYEALMTRVRKRRKTGRQTGHF